MSNLTVVIQNELSSLREAVDLYKNRWSYILVQEWGVEGNSLDKLLELQQRARAWVFPEGQKAAIDTETGKVAGTIHSIIYPSSEFPYIPSWERLTGRGYGSTHTPNGDSLICYAVQSDPNVRGSFRMLVEEQAKLATSLGLKLFVFTRPNGFGEFATQHGLPVKDAASMETYLDQITEKGLVVPNDGISAHSHLGAKLVPLLRNGKPYLPNSRPADLESAGYNVLMEYSLPR